MSSFSILINLMKWGHVIPLYIFVICRNRLISSSDRFYLISYMKVFYDSLFLPKGYDPWKVWRTYIFHYFLIIKLIIRLSQTSDENWDHLSKKTKIEKRTIFCIYGRNDFNIYLRHNIINVKGQRRAEPRFRGNFTCLCTTVLI